VAHKSLIIIGAGLSGLSAGCYAQMNGYDSRIVEHHSRPGGVAAAWKRGSYLIDGGIHFAMGHKPGTDLYEIYRQLGIVPANRFIDLTSYGRFVHEPSGQDLLLSSNLDQWASALKDLSPADAAIVDELIEGGRAFQGPDLSQIGMTKPPELSNAVDSLKDLWAMRRLLRYMTGRFNQPVSSYTSAVSDPVLRSSCPRCLSTFSSCCWACSPVTRSASSRVAASILSRPSEIGTWPRAARSRTGPPSKRSW
jgi:phytoene desaturase